LTGFVRHYAPLHATRIGGILLTVDSHPDAGRIQLNDEDVAYLMNLLRNATQPVTTQQLIDALRRQSSQAHPASGSATEDGNQEREGE
jgi:hypothetical protein